MKLTIIAGFRLFQSINRFSADLETARALFFFLVYIQNAKTALLWPSERGTTRKKFYSNVKRKYLEDFLFVSRTINKKTVSQPNAV